MLSLFREMVVIIPFQSVQSVFPFVFRANTPTVTTDSSFPIQPAHKSQNYIIDGGECVFVCFL